MVNKTTNYEFEQPTADEFYDVEVQNRNMQKVDTELRRLEDDMVSGTKLTELEEELTSHLEQNAVIKHVGSEIGVNVAGLTANNLNEALLELLLVGNSQKEELVDKLLLIDPSLPIDHDSTWTEILNTISMISTGKKWASGSAVASQAGSITITGLDFTPLVIVVEWYMSTTAHRATYNANALQWGQNHAIVKTTSSNSNSGVGSSELFNNIGFGTFTITTSNSLGSMATMNYIAFG